MVPEVYEIEKQLAKYIFTWIWPLKIRSILICSFCILLSIIVTVNFTLQQILVYI